MGDLFCQVVCLSFAILAAHAEEDNHTLADAAQFLSAVGNRCRAHPLDQCTHGAQYTIAPRAYIILP